LYRPPTPFFTDKQWGHITDWQAELAPYYDQAERMLGVTENPTCTPADDVMRTVAEKMGVADSFRLTPVGVYFGDKGETAADPFFGGIGPDRTGCVECGECMTGCRHGAKNTLVKNYLHLAEKAGVEIFDLTTVTDLLPQADGSFTVKFKGTKGRSRGTWQAQQVVLAAGAWGTQQLLHKIRAKGGLPKLSPRLGELTRTNSEALLGAGSSVVDEDRDFSAGVAITSSIYPDERTHIEPVRYGKGSNAMGLLQTLGTDGNSSTSRWRQLLDQARQRPLQTAKMLLPKRWSERTIIFLVMQSWDNSLTTYTKKGLFRTKMTSKQGSGQPNPTFIPEGYAATKIAAAELTNGFAGSTWNEFFGIPLTAHFLGGCAIGDSADTGVVDAYQRAYGYPSLSIVDGSTISANLGVNPSLSITAQAERTFALWPNRGDVDPRPSQAIGYVQVQAVQPNSPVVPAGALGALRLPLTVVQREKTPLEG
jgi:cholesterol oxidase